MSINDVFSRVQSLVNPTGTVAENYGYQNLNWNHRVATQNLQIANEELATWIRANSKNVREELDVFTASRKTSPTEHAVRCFVFSILSPQTNFRENVLATQNIMRNYDKLVDTTAVLDCLEVPFHGEGTPRLLNLGLSKAAYLWQALPWLDRLNDDNLGELFTKDVLLSQKGMGDKTTRMALALFDEQNEVFTLDQWQLRLTMALNGAENVRYKIVPTKKGYETTERAWLDFCKKYLSDMSFFEVQFTTWCGCFGAHVPHTGILS